jgi:superfamily II DNA or RNA helicase
MKGDKFQHADCDIVIASLQTMISRKYPLDGFGLTIYDETHHMSARVFVTSLMAETTKYTLGLTATPDRKDGLGHVFTWFIGRVVYRQDESDMKRSDVRVRTPKLPQRDPVQYDYSGRPDTVAMITDLCNNVARTQDVADMALSILEDPERCVLVLSERRKHLEDIYKLLEPTHGHEMGYYVGGMKASEREAVERDARVIMASVSAAAEGFDVPRLNCIILASPRSDVEQSVGRIMRTPAGVGPLYPLIIDPYDPLFPGASKKRRALYKKRGYKFEKDTHDDDDDESESTQSTLNLSHLFVES